MYQTDVPEAELNAALSDLRTQRRREKVQYQGAPFVDVFLVNLILSDEDSDRACIVDVGDTGIGYVIPWSSIPQELQQPLRRYVAQADGKLCGYCKENLCNTENGRMIVELYLGKQEHHVSRILYLNSCTTAAIGLKIRLKPQLLQPTSEFLIASQEISATFKQHICDMQFNAVAVALKS